MAKYDIVQVKAYDSNDAQSADIVITFDSAPTSGNLIVFVACPDKNAVSFSFPAGYTNVLQDFGAGVSIAYGVKVSDGTESGVQTCTTGLATTRASGFLLEVEGPFASHYVGGSSVTNTVLPMVKTKATGATGTLELNGGAGIAVFVMANDSSLNYGTVRTVSDSFITQAENDSNTGSTGSTLATKGISATASLNITGSHDGNADEMVAAVVVFTDPGAASISNSIVGGVTGSSANIKGFCSGATTTMALEYSTSSDFTGSTTTAETSSDSNLYVSYALSGLSANTLYYYRYVNDGTPVGSSYQFRTFPVGQSSFKVGFSGDFELTGSPTGMTRCLAQGIVAFQAQGDMPYIDSTDVTGAAQRSTYETWLGYADVQELTSKVAYNYIWDDHDYGVNNSDSFSATKTAMQSLYRSIFPNYTLPDASATYFAYTIGRVRFVCLDTRSERSGTTFIGASQMAWLKGEMTSMAASSDLQAMVLFVSVPWISSSDNDTWHGAQAQRTEIIDHAITEGIEDAIVICAGDAHMVAADDGTNSAYGTGSTGGMPVFHAAPLNRANSTKGGPYSEGTFAATNGQYGILDIADTGTNIAITFEGYSGADALLLSYTHNVAATLPPAPGDGSALQLNEAISDSAIQLNQAIIVTEG